MTELWCPSEADPPGSPCPVCSSEGGVTACYLHTHHGWPRAHPGGAWAQALSLAHFLGGAWPMFRLPRTTWGAKRGCSPSPLEQPQGLGAICN